MVDTRHEWLAELAACSATLASLGLPATTPDETYFDRAARRFHNADAFNLSASAPHNEAIARWVDLLAAEGVPTDVLADQLRSVTGRNTYGAYCELASYGVLADAEIPFDIQVPAGGDEILNPNGAVIDGQLTISTPVLFDVKAFGLNEHVIRQLNERLSLDFPARFVAIEGRADAGLDLVSGLIGRDYTALAAELASKGRADRGTLTIALRPQRQVQSTVMESDPYQLAKNHADFAFKFAKQFARHRPFLLIFALHPWLGAFHLTTNFGNAADNFTRSFARRTFLQFRGDRAPVFNVDRDEASRLLSGLMFLDVSQLPNEKRRHWLYLNPNARHRVPQLAWHRLAHSVPGMMVDTLEHDFY